MMSIVNEKMAQGGRPGRKSHVCVMSGRHDGRREGRGAR